MNQHKDIVVLVHGLGGSRLDMWPIARRLRRRGYETRNWGYRSFSNRVETHAARLGRELTALDRESSNRRVHLVTHSMGGVITRAMLADFELHSLGRVVMLAPPHRGSHVARQLVPFLGWLSPSLAQLSDSADSFVNQLPNTLQQRGLEFAIVEATKDRVIEPGGVFLDGYRDFARVAGHHGVLPWYADTVRLVEDFILHGTFGNEARLGEWKSTPELANV
jgi:pimeloyl-ACP methyl ester carboxylesterase